MVIQHTPHHMHFEIDFDTSRLLQYVLVALGVALLFMLLINEPAGVLNNTDISVEQAPAAVAYRPLPNGIQASLQFAPLFSAQIEAGLLPREEDQAYYIPSPD
jgi:hypothetical protein